MNGISCLISKSFNLISNPITSNKADIIPRRSSNLHLISTSSLLTTTFMLKHRAYSSSADKDVTTTHMSRSQVPEVSDNSVPYRLIGLVGITGLALLKAWEIVAPSISSKGGIEGVAAVFVASDYPAKITYRFKELCDKLFSIGYKGQVLLMKWELVVQGVEIEKIAEISEEIVNMMKSNSNVYLEKEQPYCYHSESEKNLVEFTLGYYLKPMKSKDELYSAVKDIVVGVQKIINKHGATMVPG